ncbi:MAG: glycosyltransferase family 2 protein [Eubacteriales bacterium]|nr:glycosyltransferase family 2 protein [Eubacteriales bacterium]
MDPVYSVVIPCYNEEESIGETHRRLTNVMRGMGESYELVYVNDGSRDDTPAMLDKLADGDDCVRVLHFAANRGHQVAVSAGLDYAQGQAVVIIDADLQDPPEIIPEMAARWKAGAGVVYGKRRSRAGESKFKEWSAKVYYRVLRKIAGDIFPEDTGDFRLVDKKVADVIRDMPEHARYLRGMFAWAGFEQEAVLYDRDRRYAGETHYPLKKMLRLAAHGIMSFSEKPLLWALWLGLIWLFMGGLLLLIALVMAIAGGNAGGVMRYAVTCLATGSILAALGILGAYLARVYEEVKGRPLYVVARTRGYEEENARG